MTDVLTKEQRQKCMSRIRGRDTIPERKVRSIIHNLGYRYRLNVKTLPGKPDIVLACHRKIILVHGCFWHLHHCRYGRVTPSTNSAFWTKKRSDTRKRDEFTRRTLRKAGWSILTIWECELRNEDKLKRKIVKFLTQ